MPDITMCPGGQCIKKMDCYRYRAQASEFRQSYFTDPPYDRTTGECEHFWKTEKGDRLD